MNTRRRRFLKAGLGAGSLFLPLPHAWVWAQSDGAMKLLRAPKAALVVGNGKYQSATELKNAPNDARAIAEALSASGFEVTMKLDTGREQLLEAIRAHVHLMEQRRHVGLFYFAGHGVQLAWRNYLLPVDAAIDRIEDVAMQTVDIARLMDGLTTAANPMNLVILDACRDNPFGKNLRVEQRGLSQMDAPNSTLLAYATSPGNAASDGNGANGLYTENLLREMKVPEAKIEDVFKRVRLGVRRQSNGAQIPWESTSLEEDFWFLPPRELKKRSDEEIERLYTEELAYWEKAQDATGPGPLEEYLRRFPSGNFSEIAQLQLDRVLAKQGEKKIVAVSQEGNPYTKGSTEANTDFKVGDSYTYRMSDLLSGVEKSIVTMTVAQITDLEVTFDNGVATDLLGNVQRTRRGGRFGPRQQFPLEYAVGKRWTSRFESTSPQGRTGTSTLDLHIAARERITVPAGTFDAYRIEGHGYTKGLHVGEMELRPKWWMAPGQVRWPVRTEEYKRMTTGGRRIVASELSELVSFKQG